MSKIHYRTSTNVWLSLEEFYNRGLTSQEAREVIETFRTSNNLYLLAESMGLNGNWIVDVGRLTPDQIACLVSHIENSLEQRLRSRGVDSVKCQPQHSGGEV